MSNSASAQNDMALARIEAKHCTPSNAIVSKKIYRLLVYFMHDAPANAGITCLVAELSVQMVPARLFPVKFLKF
jgi:hypothetical protein